MKFSSSRTWLALIVTVALFTVAANASVSISPSSAQVNPGAALQFTASGGGIVVWSVTGSGCSGISCGRISSSGLYVAPSTAPTPSNVTVSAISIFDASQVGTASVTIGAPTVAVSVAPASITLPVRATQQFNAVVTGTSNTAVTWSVAGPGCIGSSCGTINSAGFYTAPASVPTPAVVIVTAVSAADPGKSASANVVIQAATAVTVSVAPSAVQVSTGSQQQFTATVSGTTNHAVTWTLSGAGCSGGACGTISPTGLYSAPASVPSPATVNVIATSAADLSAFGSASAIIVSGSALSVAPASPQVKPQGQIQFSVSGPGSGIVVWAVTGSGCAGISCGSISSTGLYTAPASAPTPATVTVTATSITSPGLSGSTTATISSDNISISVSPESASVGVGTQRQFAATVTGTANTAVTWTLSGYACAGSTCGSISDTGLYTAPSTMPVPPFVTLTAKSVADPSRSASASVTLTQQVSISISPATAQVAPGQTLQFAASVTGAANQDVTWSVSGTGCSGSGCGTVSANGLYTAPETVPAAVVVTATSVADISVSASASVTILSPVSVTVSPANAIVAAGMQQTFNASVTGTQNTAVDWSVSGSGCSGSTCGTISSSGVYTAPPSLPSPPTVTIKAASLAMPSSFASATISLVSTNNSKLNGQFAFSFTGYDSSGSYLAVGSLTADGDGNIVSGVEDVNSLAAPSSNVPITGTYEVTSDNRGTMTLQSALGTFTYKLALNTLGKGGRFISFDQSGVRGSGVLKKQDSAAFNPYVFANGYVMALSGQDWFGGRVSALGLIFPDGSGFISGSTLDVNDAGSVGPTFAPYFGVYNVDESGRGTATLMVPGFGSGMVNLAFYVVSAKELFLVSADPIMTNYMILSGSAVLQNGTPFDNSSFSGPSVFTLSGTNGSAPADMIGRFTFDGVENILVNFDQNNAGQVTVGGTMNGAYVLQMNGRGTLNLSSANGGLMWYFYATGPNQGFLMDASSMAAGLGQIVPQVTGSVFSNSSILGSYVMGSDDPVVLTSPLVSGVTAFDGGSSVGGNGAVHGAQDASQISGLSPDQVVGGTYSVSGVSNNGRGAILLTSPAGANIAVWVANAAQVVGLNIGSGSSQPVVLHFEQ